MISALSCIRQNVIRSSRIRSFDVRPVTLATLHRLSPSRNYSAPPQFKKKGNILVNSINYVKDVDNFQENLSKTASNQVLAKQLMSRISQSPELLYLLSLFHHELAQLEITPASKTFSKAQIWRYRVAYVLKLARIHNVFWAQCQQQDISQRTHKLGFSPSTIGVLSPSNFEIEDYNQLQSGEYGGVDFKNIEILGKRIIG